MVATHLFETTQLWEGFHVATEDRQTRTLIAAVAAALSLMAWALPATADTITLNWIPGSIATFTHPGAPDASGSGPIPAQLNFDPLLGSLDAVDVRYIGSGAVSKTLNVAPGSYTVLASLDIRLAHDPSGFEIELIAPLGVSGVDVPNAGPFVFSEGNSRVLSLIGTQNLGMFVGGGLLELTVTSLIEIYGPAGLVYSGVGDSLTGQSRIGDSITYTYTPVPEPGSAVLAALGLGMLAARRRAGRVRRSSV